jgi:phasin family protein
MMESVMELKGYEDIQKAGQVNFDMAVKTFGEANKSVQAIAGEVTEYTKKSIEDGTAAFEQLIGVKSVEQAIEIQTTYAKKVYDNYVSQVTKLGEMYADLAKDAYKPVETAFAKKD